MNGPLGIVLTTAEIDAEGLNVVLDNVARVGATVLTTALGVLVPARPGEGTREPPLDVAGQMRLLDRPPPDEFARVLAAARASNAAGCWIQRYGYLSDETLAILRDAWGG